MLPFPWPTRSRKGQNVMAHRQLEMLDTPHSQPPTLHTYSQNNQKWNIWVHFSLCSSIQWSPVCQFTNRFFFFLLLFFFFSFNFFFIFLFFSSSFFHRRLDLHYLQKRTWCCGKTPGTVLHFIASGRLPETSEGTVLRMTALRYRSSHPWEDNVDSFEKSTSQLIWRERRKNYSCEKRDCCCVFQWRRGCLEG